MAPHLPGAKSRVELTAILKGHFDLKPSLIAQRFHFHRQKQCPDENIAVFMADLCRMAIDCEFGATLDDVVRDQFVSGLRSEAMHKRLLTEDKRNINWNGGSRSECERISRIRFSHSKAS